MSEVLREWVETITVNGLAMREEQLRLVVRDRPNWLPDRIWRWVLPRLLVLEERQVVR